MKKIIYIGLLSASILACTSKVIATSEAVGDRNIALVNPARKYFIVQNIATERTRVYEKCQENLETKVCINGTKNRLVFETEMVVGGDDMRSDVGVQNISHWVKFYQDNNSPVKYPSWYDPTFPETPKGGYGKWFKPKVMPNGIGEMRGAFGWYAAIMDPTSTGQWIHGTIGWGSDEDHFIKVAHGKGLVGFLGKTFSDMRSHGCTRHENRAVAYLQSLVPAGTALIKIYAKEGLADETLTRYEGQQTPLRWNWILTKEDVRVKNPNVSTAEAVQARGVKSDQYIDEGTYDVDQYPEALPIRTGKSGESGKSGDSYKLFKDAITQGVFLVDEGVVTRDYKHPAGIKIDGIAGFRTGEKIVPNYALQPL